MAFVPCDSGGGPLPKREEGTYLAMSKTDAKELPRGWKEVESKSRPGQKYFLHVKTGEKTWKLAHVHAKERELRHKAHAKDKDKKSKSGSSGETVHVRFLYGCALAVSAWVV
jgi:hypothetical protein